MYPNCSQDISFLYASLYGFVAADGTYMSNDDIANEAWAHREARHQAMEQGDFNNIDVIAAMDFTQRLTNEIANAGGGMMYYGAGLNGDQSDGDYQAGVVSQSEFHSSFTQMENIGINGGYFVSFNSKTFKGSDGNWYAKTSATAYAPHAENMSDKLSYFGTTEVIVGGEVISRSNFSVPSDNNSYFITQGHTWLGNAYNALPAGGNAQLRITISYNAYQFWNGHAYPANPYQYIINYP